MRKLVFVTHPEVKIDPAIPIPEWRLSDVGQRRMEHFAKSQLVARATSVYSSSERKARDCAEIITASIGRKFKIVEQLGEVDRAGYMPPEQLKKVVTLFYKRPHEAVYGREKAFDAQSRIVRAVQRIARNDHSSGDIVVISHGGVGCLFLAHLLRAPISQKFQQSAEQGGSYILIDCKTLGLVSEWRRIEDV